MIPLRFLMTGIYIGLMLIHSALLAMDSQDQNQKEEIPAESADQLSFTERDALVNSFFASFSTMPPPVLSTPSLPSAYTHRFVERTAQIIPLNLFENYPAGRIEYRDNPLRRTTAIELAQQQQAQLLREVEARMALHDYSAQQDAFLLPPMALTPLMATSKQLPVVMPVPSLPPFVGEKSNESVVTPQRKKIACKNFFTAIQHKSIESVARLLEGKQVLTLNTMNGDEETPFMCAIRRKRTDIAKMLLKAGCAIPESGLFTQAAAHGDVELITLLLERGISITQGVHGYKALKAAIKNNCYDVVVVLLERGAALNEDQKSKLLAYAAAQEVKLVALLVERGFTVNHATKGCPALIAAIDRQVGKSFSYLLKKGASLATVDDDHDTPLLAAVAKNNPAMVSMLLQASKSNHGVAQIEAANTKGITPLLRAAGESKIEIVKLLLDHNAAIEASDNRGNTPLMRALQRDRLQAVRHLLKRGALIEAANHKGDTPLMIAARYARAEVIELCKKQGSNPSARNKQGDTAFMLALDRQIRIHHKDPLMLTKFLTSLLVDADINTPNQQGLTPLMRAAQEGNLTAVQLLLAKPGIKVNAQSGQGKTALMLAAQAGTIRDKYDSYYHRNSAKDYKNVVEALVRDSRVEVNSKSVDGFTALMIAAQKGQHGLVEVLLERPEIEVNAVNQAEDSALLLAFNTVDDVGSYNRWLPVPTSKADRAALGRLLLNRGAYHSHRNAELLTPLIAACLTGNNAAVALLLTIEDMDINQQTQRIVMQKNKKRLFDADEDNVQKGDDEECDSDDSHENTTSHTYKASRYL